MKFPSVVALHSSVEGPLAASYGPTTVWLTVPVAPATTPITSLKTVSVTVDPPGGRDEVPVSVPGDVVRVVSEASRYYKPGGGDAGTDELDGLGGRTNVIQLL